VAYVCRGGGFVRKPPKRVAKRLLPLACPENLISARSTGPLAMLPRPITDPQHDRERLRRWRAGRIEMRAGQLVGIGRRWLPRRASIAEVWLQSRCRWGPTDRCRLDYHQPWGSPGFLVLDYVAAGPGTSLKTFRGALEVLDAIARQRRSLAILAHVSTSAITDRLLRRWGWEAHLPQQAGRHWIKRFYEGYPASRLADYLPTNYLPTNVAERDERDAAGEPAAVREPAAGRWGLPQRKRPGMTS